MNAGKDKQLIKMADYDIVMAVEGVDIYSAAAAVNTPLNLKNMVLSFLIWATTV